MRRLNSETILLQSIRRINNKKNAMVKLRSQLVPTLAIGVFLTALLASVTCAQDKYAVLIGVESYDPSVLGPLEFAEDDAIELGETLQDLGFKAKVMTGQSRIATGKPTTPEKILRVLKTQMNNCDEGDTMIVSLSGHGLQYKTDKPDVDGVRETYFCPEDADPNDKSTLLPMKDVVDLLRQCSATRKLMLVDACRNEFSATTGSKKAAARLQLASVHETRSSIPGGMTVLYSSSQDEFSYETEKLQHSVFSYFVIKFLKGNAASKFYDGQQFRLDDLLRYVRKRTNEYVADNNLSPAGQNPVYSGVGADWSLGEGISPIKAILNRYIDWRGEGEKLRSIRSSYSEYTLDVSLPNQPSQRIKSQNWTKDKNKSLTKNTINEYTWKIFDSPTAGWLKGPAEVRWKTAKESDFDWLISFPVLTLLDRCDELKLLGKKQVRGVETDVVMFGDETGDFHKWHFAPDGKMSLRITMKDSERHEFYPEDFIVKNGLKVISKSTTKTSAENARIEANLVKFDINVAIRDEWFEPPVELRGGQNAEPFNVDQMVSDYNLYSEELGQVFGDGLSASVRKISSKIIGIDVNGMSNVSTPQQLQQAQAMIPEIKQQMIYELGEQERYAIRAGLIYRIRIFSDSGATLMQFDISANDF